MHSLRYCEEINSSSSCWRK